MNYSHDSEKLIEFHPPKGMVPEDIQAGDTFDLVSTYRLKESGEVCLVMAGSHKLPGYDESEYKEHMKGDERKGYSDYTSSMHSAMSQGNPGEGGGY